MQEALSSKKRNKKGYMAIDEDEGVVFAVGDLILDIQTACRNAELTDKWEMCMSS